MSQDLTCSLHHVFLSSPQQNDNIFPTSREWMLECLWSFLQLAGKTLSPPVSGQGLMPQGQRWFTRGWFGTIAFSACSHYQLRVQNVHINNWDPPRTCSAPPWTVNFRLNKMLHSMKILWDGSWRLKKKKIIWNIKHHHHSHHTVRYTIHWA